MKKADKIKFISETLDELLPDPPIPLDYSDPYTLLVAVVLSAQCTDLRVNQVTKELYKKAKTPKDMVKLGVLYLCGGVYKGKRLLSEEWVRLVLDREYCFGWDETRTVYRKGGMHGQELVIDPVHGRAACMESFGANGDLFTAFVRDCG